MLTTISSMFVLIILPNYCLCQDPCDDNTQFAAEAERDPSSITDGVPICDTIPEQWYRVKGPGEIDLDITRETPSRGHCGTQYPMWMDGTLPTGGMEVEVDVCVVGLGNSCATRLSIGVKDCGHFRVYRLTSPSSCPSGYCFDVTVPTEPPPDPTCSTDMLTIDGVPDVTSLIADSDDPELSIPNVTLVFEELQFQCEFTSLRNDLFYDVKWFINDLKLAFEKRAVAGHNISSAILREQHWRRSFKMGMRVACSVAVRADPNCNAGTEVRSHDFFAGIHVSATSLDMQETDPPQNVTYTCTVPIPCWHDPRRTSEECDVQFDASGQNSTLGCPVRPSTTQSAQTTCGLTFSSQIWQTSQTLEISVTYENTFDDHTSLVSLIGKGRWPNDIPDIWKDVDVPPVVVNVRDQDSAVRNTRCKIQNDPYYKTFDNYCWFSWNTQGEFLLFRHKTFPITVHTLQELCSDTTSSTCTCGVAIQSGQDVLTWVGCGDVYRIYKRFRMRPFGCFKSGMRVEEITDGRQYKVHLPMGMHVHVELRWLNWTNWHWLNVEIHATPDLQNMVDGLCGNMDGNRSNDADSMDKVNAYRVTPNNSLFHGSVRRDWLYSSVCTCQAFTNAVTGKLFRNVTCSNRKTTSTCSVPGKDVTEVFSERCRQKRDLSLHDLDEDWPDFQLDEKYVPPAPQWKNGWSLQSASQYCTNYIHNSEVYKRCNGLSDVSPDASVFMCVDMIHVTGNTSWSEATLDAYKSECQDQVSRNSSLWSSDDGQPSVFDAVMSVLCPDNCNDRGICVKGVCHCNSGYRGADCGLDITQPPSDLVLPLFGLCDINQKLCQQTLVFGSGFIDLGKFASKTEVIQVTKDKTFGTGTVKTRPGFVHSRNEARLTFDPIDMSSGLMDLDSPSVVGYRISLTNNGQDYGGEAILLPYDSTCFSCSVTGSQPSCEIKTGYCSINFRCVAAGTTHDRNGSLLCNPKVSPVSWSAEDAIVTTSSPTEHTYQNVTVATGSPPEHTCQTDVLTIDGVPDVTSFVVDSDDPELFVNDLVMEELQFRCGFPNPRNELFYDVKWFINDHQLVFEERAVPGHNIFHAILREQHWRRNFNLGMRVACSVAVRVKSNCNPGPEIRSNDFFAGIHVSATSLNMLETDPPQNVTYTSTVPIPCYHERGRPSKECHVQLDASGQTFTFGCPVRPSTTQSVQTTCGLTFSSRTWQTPQTLEISVTYENTFDDRTSLVSHKGYSRWRNDFPDIWKDVIVPPIMVNVHDQDKDVRSTKCSVYNDPYYRTFDNFGQYRYYSVNFQGEFMIFRHKSFPIKVHILQEACSADGALSCTCGVAVQSGQDVLTWVGCGDVYRIYKQFRMRVSGCFKGGMRVEEIIDSSKYRVHLPTGIRVVLQRRQWNNAKFLNVDIYTTPNDQHMVDGLCGNMDGDPSNDVINADTINSYRVHIADSLFYGTNRTEWQYNSVCSCHTSQHSNKEQTRNVICSNRRSTTTCSVPGKDITEVFSQTCRQKRDLSLHDLDEDWPDFKLDENYVPPAPQWRNGWSMQSATQYCTEYINNSELYKRCNGLSGVSPDFSLTMCVDMIHVTGNTTWSEATLDVYQTDCQDQVSRNSSLWSSRNGQPSVFDSVISVLCPDNCNGHGVCVHGVCQCNSGFQGADCALDITEPPNDLVLPQFGLCDVTLKLCQQTLVLGSGFIDLGKFGYKTEVIQVTKDETFGTGTVKTRPGIVHFRNEARLIFDPIDMSSGLKDLDSPSVVGYRISLTNNGQDYGGEAIFLPYDSTCFSCSSTGSQTSCEIKADYCSIHFKCITTGTTYEGDECLVCNPTVSTVSWSSKGCAPPADNKILIIALTVPCLIMIAAVFIVVVVKKSGVLSQRADLPISHMRNGEEPPPYSSFVRRPLSAMSTQGLTNTFLAVGPNSSPPSSTSMSKTP